MPCSASDKPHTGSGHPARAYRPKVEALYRSDSGRPATFAAECDKARRPRGRGTARVTPDEYRRSEYVYCTGSGRM